MKTRWIRTGLGLNLIVNGQMRVVSKDHKHYSNILQGLEAGNDSVVELLDEFTKKIQNFDGVDFQVVAGELLYRGKPYENEVVAKKIMAMLDNGIKAAPLISFLEKVEMNPTPVSIEHIWKWMANDGLAISDDGDIIGFKYVTKVSEMSDSDPKKVRLLEMGAEYTDTHSRTYRYNPGDTPSIPRHLIKFDPNTACGVGLHVGDLSYVMGHTCILAVKINPMDVCTVANDDSRKIRVCRFTCLDILNPNDIDGTGFKMPVYSVNGIKLEPTEFKQQAINVAASQAAGNFCDNEPASHWSQGLDVVERSAEEGDYDEDLDYLASQAEDDEEEDSWVEEEEEFEEEFDEDEEWDEEDDEDWDEDDDNY